MDRKELEEKYNDLLFENYELKEKIMELEEELKNIKLSLSLEEVIKGYADVAEAERRREQESYMGFNPFNILRNSNGLNGKAADGEIRLNMMPEDGELFSGDSPEDLSDTEDGE